MPMPTKAFGTPGGVAGAMTGGGRNIAAPTAASDGLGALQARLAGAKRMKPMKPPTRKGRQKADLTGNKGTNPGKGV